MDNDLTFFTNSSENSLYDRFNNILKKDTQFFDVLVGYFRASGFYLLQDALDKVEKTRILIGIDTDQEILKLYEQSQEEIKEIKLSTIEATKKYKDQIVKEFENSEDSEDVEKGVNKFIQLLKSGKLEIRIYTKQPIHAKLYIMKSNPDTSVNYGRVITGSSNFSQNGLISNLEFNVELKDKRDVQFAENSFNELWKDSVEITQACIDTIENQTWIKENITPYEMYVKFLYEYFKEEINDDKLNNNDSRYYPDGFKPLQYQKDAVIQAKRILEKHNGIFISDVVGLGKTYICALLAQELDGKKLFLCPPVLVDYWRTVLFNFGIRGFRVESVGKLDKIIEDGTSMYKYVFVDESHRFRNSNTESYKLLHEICFGKKVVLISATPQNNYTTDIANQLYLFQSKNNSTIVGVRNLENFFNELKKNRNQYDKDTDLYRQAIRDNSEKIRDKVLREVMIRRTRTEIQKTYGNDLKQQGLTFPKVSDPQKLVYSFNNKAEQIFNKTIEKLAEINYSAYKPLTYMKSDKLTPMQNTLLVGQSNLGGFMKGILVKRLESSKYAFEKTLGRFIESYQNIITNLIENGYVLMSKKLNEDDLEDEDFEFIVNDRNKELIKIPADNFNSNFLVDLQKDLHVLEDLKNDWNTLESDDKLEYFIKELKTNSKLVKNKLIIFTESTETAEYLTSKIQKELSEKVILFSGSMPDSIRDNIRNNFDPNVEENKQQNEYRILITTDVLAEGINLHRSNVIINYDLPWNPTRIMQRVGRINRVGTKHKEIFIFNFFPTDASNNHMNLEENIITKIQMFHDILGEDSKFLTESEEVNVHELFRRMNTYVEEDDEPNSELTYLKEIRDIRDNDKDLFNKIKNYPKKIKIARTIENYNDSLITFFRKGYLKRFYITSNNNTEEINFETAINIIRASKKETSKKVTSNFYNMLKNNKKAFENDEKQDNTMNVVTVTRKGTSNAKTILKLLKECRKLDSSLTDIEIEKLDKIIDVIEIGDLPDRILKEGIKFSKKITGINDLLKFYKQFENIIPDVYIEQTNSENEKELSDSKKTKEIILSEYFI